MKRLVIVLIACTALAALRSAGAAPSHATPPPALQEEEDEEQPIVDRRPEVKELCDRLKGHVAERGEEDTQAIGLLERLTREFAKSGPKDRAAIVKSVAKCLDAKRRPHEDGTPNNALYLAAAEALGAMGPESVKPLEKNIGHKRLRDDLDLQVKLIESLGHTRSRKAVDRLVALLLHPTYRLQAAAGSALGEYSGFDQDLRKEIFKEVLKVHNMVIDSYNSGLTSDDFNERRRIVEPPLNTTLEKMSGQKRKGRDREFWNAWWNENKRKDWDADEE